MDKDNDYRYAAYVGEACAHVAAYHEAKRLARRMAACHKATGRR